MDKKIGNDSNLKPEDKLNLALDKMLKLQAGKNEPSFLRKVVYIVSGISVLAFVGLICVTLYKNSFTTESVLSTLLAFFSIFISIFFYFKADETSSKFYDSSYKIMKDIAVTLGKIEERFGEKLNSLNDKVAHLDKESNETTEKIDDTQEDRNRITYSILERANFDTAEKEKYKKELEEKDKEINNLRMQRRIIQDQADDLRRKMITQQRMNESSGMRDSYGDLALLEIVQSIISTNSLPDELAPSIKRILRRRECIDGNGEINIPALLRFRDLILHRMQE